ncbi:MAG: SGNH/GDSL hydrolase family protein [Cyanobacteria bacterium]|nr:SGNH/GDSL hydrolase family protein [Cyanobacteriota bacterium]
MTTLTRRRKVIYGLVTVVLMTGLMVIALLATDIYVHRRTQTVAGVNVWGYRGAPIGAKRDGEVRIVMVGGSTVYGWGLPSHESIASFLEQRLNASAPGRVFSVVNLGAPGQGAYGFIADLSDYAYLDYDIVVMYEGYNDLGTITPRGLQNYLLWRHQSPVFRWTGYYPILPIVLREKADLMTGRGTAQPGEVRFAARVGAGALRAVAAVTGDLAGKVGGLTPTPVNAPAEGECIEMWKRYCGSVRDAISWARARHKPVIFVTQPYVSDLHKEQQASVAAMLKSHFGADAGVAYVNLGEAVDMRNLEIAYDGVHLIAAGNDTIASRLVEPVLQVAR